MGILKKKTASKKDVVKKEVEKPVEVKTLLDATKLQNCLKNLKQISKADIIKVLPSSAQGRIELLYKLSQRDPIGFYLKLDAYNLQRLLDR